MFTDTQQQFDRKATSENVGAQKRKHVLETKSFKKHNQFRISTKRED